MKNLQEQLEQVEKKLARLYENLDTANPESVDHWETKRNQLRRKLAGK